MALAADPAAKDASAKIGSAKAESTQTDTFTSPAERSVRKAVPVSPAERSKTAELGKASAAADTTSLVEENPGLGVELTASAISAHGFLLKFHVTTSVVSSIRIDINWGDGSEIETEYTTDSKFLDLKHIYAEVGTHTITVTVTDLNNEVSATNSLDVTTRGSEFTPYAPTRLLDTRDGTGASSARAVEPNSLIHVKVGGNGGLPAGVSAVALNLTVTNAAGPGHISSNASDAEEGENTSNVNFVAGQTVPNLAIVPVGADGYITLVNHSYGKVDLIADVTGYFTRSAAAGYTSLDPTRVVDSRQGLGTAKGQVAGQSTFGLQIAGRSGIPGKGVTAVALNVTVTDPKAAGHLTVFPSGQQAPTTSNLNFTAGLTVANSVIVPVGPDGRIELRNGSWSPADVIVDVVGYYSADSESAFLSSYPRRLYDSRERLRKPLAGQDYLHLAVSADRPSIEAYVLNTTVTNTQDDGHLSVAPDPNTGAQYDNGTQVRPTPPSSSNLNWTKGTTVANLAQASTGRNGIIDFWNRGWKPTDLVVDVQGLYDTR
ncbi:hypothetical protein J7F03_24590 [Streptomyces sp. ISL-43]|uniref:hypothetical protein n=1 Tax=Streptomyces sp. ISL-43 TaxID=2819183 RepID=UPI001BEA825C|nr:hypothetical protein [Streptomyces sp. ISL-43]MBT2450196.1 hypothetical protein [Streptomyces sp. ISL-43]